MNTSENALADLTLGSPEWTEAVYRTGPARAVDGKGRSTVRHMQTAVADEDEIVLEGRLENSAATLLKILRNAGYIKRFKSQPFKLTTTAHEVEAFPDFLVDLTDTRRYVIECKTSRWLTEPELEQQGAVCNALQGTTMTIGMWTDKYPFSRATFHNLNHLRRAVQLGYTESEIKAINDAVKNGPLRIKEIKENIPKIHFDQILAAAYLGNVFLNFLIPITENTYVYKYRDDRLLATLFVPWQRTKLGWESLPGIEVGRV